MPSSFQKSYSDFEEITKSAFAFSIIDLRFFISSRFLFEASGLYRPDSVVLVIITSKPKPSSFCWRHFAYSKFSVASVIPVVAPSHPPSIPFDVKIRPLTQMDYEIFNTQIYKKEV